MKNKLITIFIFAVCVLILLNPAEMIGAASGGLKLWLNEVFPSLFPFMAGINLLAELGAVEALGRALGPVTKPLFGIPGSGGFALISGMVSGYPMGVKITAGLYEKGELSKPQAQRLLGFVNNCGPLFVIGAVGAGMFKNARAGYFILGVHYFSALLTGAILWLFAKKSGVPRTFEPGGVSVPALSRPRPFGEILGAGVQDAMASMLKVGGFIVLFSVLVKAFDMFSLTGLAKDIISGFLEMTNGVRAVANDGGLGLKTQIAAAAGIVSFGGLSIHAQSAAFLQGSGLSAKWYYAGKSIQTALSAALAAVLFPLLPMGLDAGAGKEEVFARIFTGGGFARDFLVSLALAAGIGLAALAVSAFGGDGKKC